LSGNWISSAGFQLSGSSARPQVLGVELLSTAPFDVKPPNWAAEAILKVSWRGVSQNEKRRSRRKFGALQAMPPKCLSDPRYRLRAIMRPARCSAGRPLGRWSSGGSQSVAPAGSSLAPSIARLSALKFKSGGKALVTVAPAKILYHSPPPGETRSTHINFRIDLDAANIPTIGQRLKRVYTVRMNGDQYIFER